MNILLGILKSLVVDKATNMVAEHVEKAVEDLGEQAKAEIDKAVNEDATHAFNDLKSYLNG